MLQKLDPVYAEGKGDREGLSRDQTYSTTTAFLTWKILGEICRSLIPSVLIEKGTEVADWRLRELEPVYEYQP